MDIGADIFIGAVPPPETLRASTARAFGVSIDRVAFRHPEEPWPDADVILEYLDDTSNPGDYPLQLLPWVHADRLATIGDSLSALARELGVPIITAAASYDPMDQEFYLPDGSTYRIEVDQDDDDGVRNTAIMRRLIAEHSPATAVAS